MEKSKIMERPNIFEIAIKELSQDAFITWLLMWADDSYKDTDEDLHQCGKEFVSTLIKNQYPNFSESINKVEAGRQWKKIDVWAKVNDKYLIIIEDKINSREHSKQLEKYKEIAEKWCQENNKEKPICIYLKTGNECKASLEKIEEEKEKGKKYHIFSRKDFINLLNKFEQIKNNIFVDFRERMLQIDNLTNGYKDKQISKWEGYEWQGFYMAIEDKVKHIEWGYRNTVARGFWSFWLTWEKVGDVSIYSQIEQGRLCFKIKTESEKSKNWNEIRDEFYELISAKGKKYGCECIKKPKRKGNGPSMNYAIVEQKDWLGEGVIDVDKAVENLNQYLRILREFVEEYNEKE